MIKKGKAGRLGGGTGGSSLHRFAEENARHLRLGTHLVFGHRLDLFLLFGLEHDGEQYEVALGGFAGGAGSGGFHGYNLDNG